jgi:hypothetical protein
VVLCTLSILILEASGTEVPSPTSSAGERDLIVGQLRRPPEADSPRLCGEASSVGALMDEFAFELGYSKNAPDPD